MIAATSNKKAATVAGAQYTKNSRIEVTEVRFELYGRCRSVGSALGLTLPTTHKKHTPCQGCHGVDRFRIDKDFDDTGRWICGGGGNTQSGDLFSLLMHVHGWSFLDALKAIADELGISPNMDESERLKLRQKAAKAQQKIQAEINNRNQLMNEDAYMLDCAFNLETAIKERSASRSIDHSSSERIAIARLCGAIESNYPEVRV